MLIPHHSGPAGTSTTSTTSTTTSTTYTYTHSPPHAPAGPLLLPRGAAIESADCLPAALPELRAHAIRHAVAWGAFVAGRLGSAARTVYLVSGCDVAGWVAGDDAGASRALRFAAVQRAGDRAAYAYAWATGGPVRTKRDPDAGSGADDGGRAQEQTLFVRGFKITLAPGNGGSKADVKMKMRDDGAHSGKGKGRTGTGDDDDSEKPAAGSKRKRPSAHHAQNAAAGPSRRMSDSSMSSPGPSHSDGDDDSFSLSDDSGSEAGGDGGGDRGAGGDAGVSAYARSLHRFDSMRCDDI